MKYQSSIYCIIFLLSLNYTKGQYSLKMTTPEKSADKAVTYVREELQLKLITLVDEEKDVKKLAEIFEYQLNKKG